MTTVALADDMKMGSGDMSMMMKPGAETQALAKFFKGNASWKGNVAAGAMGKDSPAMTTKGTAVGKEILGGWWYMMDVEDVIGTGKDAMTWKGHMLVGYDNAAKAYRSYSVDNMGASSSWTGTLDGDKFVLETDQPMTMMGQSFKDRLTWVLQGDGTAQFTDEHQMAGSTDWQAWETGVAKMSGAPKASAMAKKKD